MLDFKRFSKQLKNLKREEIIKKNDKILIAFSGGPDSVFLFYLLNYLKSEYNLELALMYVNHNLRSDVDNDLNFVKDFSKKNGVKLYIESVDVNSHSKKMKKSIELAARELRYEALEKVFQKEGFTKIATGHNLDDNVETFIFRLLRGTSIRGLKGIPRVRENIIRPILQFEKKIIVNFLEELNQKFIIDYTNNEIDYTRNFIRNEVFPKFIQINPRFKDKINNLILEINDRDKNVKVQNVEVSISKDKFVRYLENEGVKEISREKINKIYEIIFNKNGLIDSKGSKEFYLGNGKILQKKYGQLKVVEKEEKKDYNIEVIIKKNQSVEWYNYEIILYENFEIFEKEFLKKNNQEYNYYEIESDLEIGKLVVRSRKAGDTILGKNSEHQKIKKILIDEKIPKWERDKIPIIENINDVEDGDKREILLVSNIKSSKFLKKVEFNMLGKEKRILIIGRKDGR